MSVVIVGGNERMVCQYMDICKNHGCKAKVYVKENGSLKKKLGTPDYLLLFTSTVSHKMMLSASKEAKRNNVKHLNRIFRDKGVELLILKREENAMLIYVCRRTQLAKDLERPGAKELLERYGYTDTSVDGAIERLRMRLASGDGFPHEIGLFLGYPVEDVLGFIENAGQNCKCCGCWKVYCNECEAVRTFARYKKCRDIYKRLWQDGRSVLQLTVAA